MAIHFLSPTTIVKPIPLTLHEAFSGILGSISIACWIFLLVPQVLENYRNRSASAISLPFILIWLLGDLCSFIGSVWAGLVPTVIALGVYFLVADTVMLLQCLYYNWLNKSNSAKGESTPKANGHGSAPAPSEREIEPLLGRSIDQDDCNSSLNDAIKNIEESDGSRKKTWLRNTVSILSISALGTIGWALAWGSGVWRPSPVPHPGSEFLEATMAAESPLGAQIFGYASALLYLGARIPQIIKNAKEKSCEGLSLLFFMLSLAGNSTYGAGILAHSLDRNYVITNVPWLIGSFGTMVEDVFIFGQFRTYGDRSREQEDQVDAQEDT